MDAQFPDAHMQGCTITPTHGCAYPTLRKGLLFRRTLADRPCGLAHTHGCTHARTHNYRTRTCRDAQLHRRTVVRPPPFAKGFFSEGRSADRPCGLAYTLGCIYAWTRNFRMHICMDAQLHRRTDVRPPFTYLFAFFFLNTFLDFLGCTFLCFYMPFHLL